MQLESFRIFDFRSINDSGVVELARITALLGRNESGKSNLLLALRTLNPVEGFGALNPTKDFPRHRRLSECTPETKAVWSRWCLAPSEKIELSKIWWRAAKIEYVTVDRPYGATRSVSFENLPALQLNTAEIKTGATAIVQGAKTACANLGDDQKASADSTIAKFEQSTAIIDDIKKWATDTIAGIVALTEGLKSAKVALDSESSNRLVDFRSCFKAFYKCRQSWASARFSPSSGRWCAESAE